MVIEYSRKFSVYSIMSRLVVADLDPAMTVSDALAETVRIRCEKSRARNIRGLAKYYETHRDEVLQKKREYHEAHRDEINARRREARARAKISRGLQNSQGDSETKK